ncbi:hypothetical protein [Xenophilus azovorans]|uniref:hypothetical protein n=1 Tax=Xenophilus azovorans TaxID=151755 RepID=UPI0012EE83F0|nr:hypothetical protein [Xenophilus azovorans]
MINGYPTKDELKNRIKRQLSWRPEDPFVHAMWGGYLAALLEWGLIDVAVYDELVKLIESKNILLNFIGYELFSDEPLSKEQETEIRKLRDKKSNN